jgi:hypothetical protein
MSACWLNKLENISTRYKVKRLAFKVRTEMSIKEVSVDDEKHF